MWIPMTERRPEVLAKVNAVYQRYPAEVAHIAFSILASSQTPVLDQKMEDLYMKEVWQPGLNSLMFVEPTDPADVERVCEFVQRHLDEELFSGYKKNYDKFEPLKSISLNPQW